MLIFELGVRSGIRASVCRICILRVVMSTNGRSLLGRRSQSAYMAGKFYVLNHAGGTLEADLGRNDRAYTRDVGSLPIAAGIVIVLS